MKRNAIDALIKWKNDEERKPMVLRGARQVGKTWLMKEFGKNYYEDYVYFNFDEEDGLKSIFEANNYHLIAAGSLLGTLLAQPKSYPVGMVNLLNITPLTFDEFLNATDEPLYTYYQSIAKEQQIEELFHNRLMEAYNNYLIIGGMPECVASWMKHKDPTRISQGRLHYQYAPVSCKKDEGFAIRDFILCKSFTNFNNSNYFHISFYRM